MFFASKRNAQAVTTLMGDTKVELGDDVAVSHSHCRIDVTIGSLIECVPISARMCSAKHAKHTLCFAPPPVPMTEPALLYVIAGQSNAAGKAVPDLSPDELKRIAAVSDRVTVVLGEPVPPTDDPRLRAGRFSLLDRAVPPFAASPDLLLGLLLAEHWVDRRIVLLKRCMLGTSLAGSWNLAWDAARAQRLEPKFCGAVGLYQTLIADMHALKREDDVEIRGVVWVQGERDIAVADEGICAEAADAYEDNLRALIRALRTDLADGRDLPVCTVAVSTAKYASEPAGFLQQEASRGTPKAKVVRALRAIAATEPTVHFLPDGDGDSSSDFFLPRLDDGTHFDSEGQRRLGTRLARTFCDLAASE